MVSMRNKKNYHQIHPLFRALTTVELHCSYKTVDKREYLVIIRDNFCQFCIKTYVVTPQLNRLDETVQMRGHNIWFR